MGTGRGHFGGLGLSSGLRPWGPFGLVGFILTAKVSLLLLPTSAIQDLPAELKHITKRWKVKQQRFPQ